MMCQKMIINQNECGGRSKQDEESHRDTLDKKVFTQRRPFRRDLEDMRRLAALFGTTNNISNIIKDRLGNRRIIVTEVKSRNHKAYDAIDKVDLWMAVYALYKANFEWKILGEEIKELNQYSSAFEAHEFEYEMINKYFEKCESTDKDNLFMTASDIMVYIHNKTLQKPKLNLIIQEMYRLKFKLEETITSSGAKKKAYCIKLNQGIDALPSTDNSDLPF